MDGSNGVKITVIETQYVTSDVASFKSLVQCLTGKQSGGGGCDAAQPGRPPQRPRPSCSGAGSSTKTPAGEVLVGGAAGRAETTCLEEQQMHEICDFSELLYDGAIDRRYSGGSYNDFPY